MAGIPEKTARILMVPVTTKATYSIGPILIGFIIIGLLVGVGLYLYLRNHHNEYEEGGEHMIIKVSNTTTIPYTLSLPSGRKVKLAPKYSTKISATRHENITAEAHNYDGTATRYNYTLSHPEIKHIYITPSGIRTNVSGSDNVQFINQSYFPVMFVERSSRGGRRWASDIVPPQKSTSGNFVGKITTWEVVHPTDENQPIAEITVGGKAQKLIFDGQRLISQ